MTTTSKSIDMLHGPLTGKLIRFALPIAASSMLQQLFNFADTAVVGRFADSNALAAVGTNGEIVALLVSLSAGLSAGVNVLLARMIGSHRKDALQSIIHSALFLALGIGLSGLLLGQWIARPLLLLIHTPETILDAAVSYLKIYFFGCPMLLLYDFGSAILRSKGDSKRPFLILTLSGILNLALNLFFVIVCRLNVAGVALATDLSTAFAAMMVLFLLTRETDEFHLNVRKMRFQKKHAGQILKIGVPAALQGAVFCIANIFVQAAINQFGAIAAAGSAIAMNFEYFAYYLITAFGQAATTFTSQNYAAGNQKRCKQILYHCLLCSFIFSAMITVPLTIGRTFAAGLFSSDAEVIQAACLRIMLIFVFEPICSFYEIPAGFLRGMGHSTLPAILTVLGTCLLRIVWIETVFRKFQTLSSLFVAFPVSWVVTAALLWAAYGWSRHISSIPESAHFE